MSSSHNKDRAGGTSQRASTGANVKSVKPVFKVDEKVLCYEPDLKKARVLYDSKVLEVVNKSDSHGSFHEYKIHFQGWKDTWDRYVREDNVLKDTDENRDLQRRLYEAAQQFNRNASKKKKKKGIRERLQTSAAGKDGFSTTPVSENRKEGGNSISDSENDSTDAESSDADLETEQLSIPRSLRKILEMDYFNVRQKELLVNLPARMSVIDILERYVWDIARHELRCYIEKINKFPSDVPSMCNGSSSVPGSTLSGKVYGVSLSKTNGRAITDIVNEKLMKTFERITYCKKIVEDIRIMFDFLLYHMLLYENEDEQYLDFLAGRFTKRNLLSQGVFANLLHNSIKQETTPPPLILKKAEKAQRRRELAEAEAAAAEKERKKLKAERKILKAKSRSSKTKAKKSKSINEQKKEDKSSMPPPPTTPKLRHNTRSSVQKPPQANVSKASEPQIILVSESQPNNSAQRNKSPKAQLLLQGSTAKQESSVKVKQEILEERDEPPPAKRKKLERRVKSVSIVAPEPNSHKHESQQENQKSNSGTPAASKDHSSHCRLQNRCKFPWACVQLNNFMDDMSKYKMLPTEETRGEKRNGHPSLCYGAHHLLRLFVKIPEILNKTSIPRKNIKGIVAELNNILEFMSEVEGLATQSDYYNPSIRMYEEDFINEQNCHLFSSTKRNPLILGHSSSDAAFGYDNTAHNASPANLDENHTARASGSNNLVAVNDDEEDAATNNSTPRTRVGTRNMNRQVIKRNPRRVRTGNSMDQIIIEGNALGVRKSLSQEELSRETLVAASNPSPSADGKAYSLRTHCRVPYK